MNGIRFLNPAMHGALDYLAAVGLMGLPFLLGFTGLSLWLSVAGGAGLIGYSLLTDYKFGAVRLFSFNVHLALDLAAAAAFIAAPFLFGWNGIIIAYYLTMAGGVIGVVALSENEPTTA